MSEKSPSLLFRARISTNGLGWKPPELPLESTSSYSIVKLTPLIQNTISPATLIYTDEYRIYARLIEWGYKHKQVNHGQGEYARYEDGDG